MKTFSVIIPTYNRIERLLDCLASISAQRYKPHEIIVVDDGSTDNTREVLNEIEDVTLISQANAGPGAARNTGIKLATGDYIAFLDSDDLWFPWSLETLLNAVNSNDNPRFLVGTNTQIIHTDEVSKIEERVSKTQAFKCFYSGYRGFRIPVPTQSTAIRRDVINEVGGFAELYVGEDVDLWLRLGLEPNFVWIREPFLSAQRNHDARITHNYMRAVEGVSHLLHAEASGIYPGGDCWRSVREARLSDAARPTSLSAANYDLPLAFELYRKSFGINFRQNRWRYLLGFAIEALRRRITNLPQSPGGSK